MLSTDMYKKEDEDSLVFLLCQIAVSEGGPPTSTTIASLILESGTLEELRIPIKELWIHLSTVFGSGSILIDPFK